MGVFVGSDGELVDCVGLLLGLGGAISLGLGNGLGDGLVVGVTLGSDGVLVSCVGVFVSRIGVFVSCVGVLVVLTEEKDSLGLGDGTLLESGNGLSLGFTSITIIWLGLGNGPELALGDGIALALGDGLVLALGDGLGDELSLGDGLGDELSLGLGDGGLIVGVFVNFVDVGVLVNFVGVGVLVNFDEGTDVVTVCMYVERVGSDGVFVDSAIFNIIFYF